MERITEQLFDSLRKVINPKFKLAVTSNVTVNDVLQYRNEKHGLFLAYHSILEDNNVSYSAIFIDRHMGRISCFNTRGRTNNCMMFLALCEMESEGFPFVYTQYRYQCKYDDLGFITHIADKYTTTTTDSAGDDQFIMYNFAHYEIKKNF